MLFRILLFLVLIIPIYVLAGDVFTKDLYFGMTKEPEVVKLQEFLRSRGYFIYPASTGNYFQVTVEAVRKFQKANNISPVGGYFGPQSRKVANSFYSPAAYSSLTGKQGVPAAPSAKNPSPNTSPYKGKIAISYVSGTSESPEYEYLVLTNNSGGEKINITGFAVENSNRARFFIPKGHDLPGFSSQPLDYIILKPGERATIYVGKQERRMDFRVNICTGYFDEFSAFNPSLSHQCPRPDVRYRTDFSDQCLRFIDSIGYCRTVSQSNAPDSDCSRFVVNNLNYVGCVNNYRSRPDFYSKEWMIWMQSNEEFFRNRAEKVILKDQSGRVVDEYNY